MASEIRVNQIQSRTGVSTISFTETGPIFAGVSTVQGSFTVDEDLNVGNNLNVSGVLTYEDVTNVDSVGVITARNGINVTSGNIGIGENNPQNSLHISGSSPAIRFADTGANASAFSIIEDNDGLLKLRNDAGNSGTGSGIAFEVDAAERLRITSSGNIGIGTNNPFDATGYKSITLAGSTGGAIAFREGATTRWEIYGDNSNGIRFYDRTNTTERLRITGIGSVGVGVADPDSKFHVISSSNHVATFEYSSTSDMAIQLKNSQGSMYFGLGGGEEFMVGTDPDLNGSGNTKLSVDSSGRVRMPEQPAALVYKTGTTQAFSADGLVTYDSTSYSQGITIANTRSRMTVPVAGKYMVNACTSGSVSSLSAGDGWKLQILKNGTVYNHNYGYPIETTGSTAGQELAYTVSMVVDCSINDYIEIKIENIGGAQANMSYGYFGVYLLG